MSQENERNSNLENFINGGLAALITITFTHPTEVIKRIVQANVLKKTSKKEYYFETVSKLWKSEGIAGFYKGLRMTYIKIVPTLGVAFMVNEMMKKMLNIK